MTQQQPQSHPIASTELESFEEELSHVETAIHLPGSIQAHGILLACEEEHLTITYASCNCEAFLGIPASQLIQQPLSSIFTVPIFSRIVNVLQEAQDKINDGGNRLVECHLQTPDGERAVHVLIHRNPDGWIILEILPRFVHQSSTFLNFYQTVRDAAQSLQTAPDLTSLYQCMTQEIQRLTQFDRIVIYQYDEQWNGKVVAESKKTHLESLLGLHFPDIDTRPCRSLYQSHWSRLIPDIEVSNVEIIPACSEQTEQSLDLTHAVLRGYSPCHQKYLHNMGVRATLVLSIIHDNQLWGLIACHHCAPHYFSYEAQQACEFLSQIFSVELTVQREQDDYDYHLYLKDTQAQLVEQISHQQEWWTALLIDEPNLLSLFNAAGVAVIHNDDIQTKGTAPDIEAIATLVQWLRTEHPTQDVFHSAALSHNYPAGQTFTAAASGLLAVMVTPQDYLLWFRPEVIQTVNWAGNPHETQVITDDSGQISLTPRNSFALWQETVQGRSLPWQSCELAVASEFRQALINIVLRHAAALYQLNQNLARSNAELERFAYIASHDLQEPLNLVASYVQLLEMRYVDRLDTDAQEFIGFAVEGVSHMQALIDDLLAYSRVETQGKDFTLVNMQAVLERVLKQLHNRLEAKGASVTYETLPTIWGDRTQMLQLLQNLIANALKFCSQELPKIHIWAQCEREQWQFFVRDNGIGIEPQFQERVFIIFQRLHTRDEYPGTGIGLAICKKIVERHGGTIAVESEVDNGATFHFTLPLPPSSPVAFQ